MVIPATITNSLVDELTEYEWSCLEEGLSREFVKNLQLCSGHSITVVYSVWLGFRKALGYDDVSLLSAGAATEPAVET